MTLEEAQTQLDNWIKADAAIQKGQSYSIDGLSLSRTDGDQITAKINYWQRKVNELQDIANGHTPGIKTAAFR